MLTAGDQNDLAAGIGQSTTDRRANRPSSNDHVPHSTIVQTAHASAIGTSDEAPTVLRGIRLCRDAGGTSNLTGASFAGEIWYGHPPSGDDNPSLLARRYRSHGRRDELSR